jgi:histidinol phosphatase-like PHP family hydrolase
VYMALVSKLYGTQVINIVGVMERKMSDYDKRIYNEEIDFSLVDFHVHLDNSTIDEVLKLPQARDVKFGIVEHAGTRANQYPIMLSNDDELYSYLKMLAGKPIFRGIQAEYIDWMSCFSPAATAELDFVLSDAMTMPGRNGERVKLWLPGVEIGDAQTFIDRYVDWHVEVMSKEPLDIFANTTWLPEALLPDYDKLWTERRMQKVIDSAVNYGIALEISSSYRLPRLPFLKMAKAAGVKFSFGSNGRYPNMGLLDYSVRIARELGLKITDMFTPAHAGKNYHN